MQAAMRGIAPSLFLAASTGAGNALGAQDPRAGSPWPPSRLASAESRWSPGFVRPAAFDHETPRQHVSPSVDGDDIRVTLSNRCSTAPLQVDAASVGLIPGATATTVGAPRRLTYRLEPARLAVASDSGDHLHPGDAGSRAIARPVARSLEGLADRP